MGRSHGRGHGYGHCYGHKAMREEGSQNGLCLSVYLFGPLFGRGFFHTAGTATHVIELANSFLFLNLD